MKLCIEKLDHFGQGIGYIDGKTCFVPFCIPGDIVDVNITKDTKNFSCGEIASFIKKSPDRKNSFCPLFGVCGGCHLQTLSYGDTVKYKTDRLINILHNYDIENILEFIPNQNDKFYRNKIELKIQNGKLGFYKNKTHELIEIEKCFITKECINNFFDELKLMNIKNADVMIRCNYNDEVLIWIKTEDNIVLKEDYSKYKVVGIIVNDKCLYGESFFLDKINNMFFKVSYDSFFQVNSYINSKLFDIIQRHIDGSKVLDLYSGVGTLSIMASKKASKVYGIEVVPNAILNSMENVRMNNINNCEFLLGKVEDKISLIKDEIDTIIIDPPRMGVDKKAMDVILKLLPKQIVYISCETTHLQNDLKILLEKYNINKVYALDMFSYTYHCETICVLERKN